MNLKIAIIDDESIARDRVRRFLESHMTNIQIIGEAGNGIQGLEIIRQHQPDLIFLDIQMPEMDGFAMLAELLPDERPYVIFTTAYDEYAIKAFEIHALDYLLKPYTKERFDSALERMITVSPQNGGIQKKLESLLAQAAPPSISRLVIKDQGRVMFVPLDQIDWIESAGNYVIVHTHDKSHMMRETMTEMERKLPEVDFFRVSRSAIVRADQIMELRTVSKSESQVVLNSKAKVKTTLPLKELQAKLNHL
ncbi:response regulator transcription factor [Verrucomicrobiaceae bacterium N1E253]|uniref:Response regulator transcription factor n=1 Tax=Oceaniferula marina TaxID=2748318 RepID=A0A851GI86_9BACT|nr:response regulator [Oceaniferula marina]NWK54340.1 response regulator transcription factor [Oceaniferula marina]